MRQSVRIDETVRTSHCWLRKTKYSQRYGSFMLREFDRSNSTSQYFINRAASVHFQPHADLSIPNQQDRRFRRHVLDQIEYGVVVVNGALDPEIVPRSFHEIQQTGPVPPRNGSCATGVPGWRLAGIPPRQPNERTSERHHRGWNCFRRSFVLCVRVCVGSKIAWDGSTCRCWQKPSPVVDVIMKHKKEAHSRTKNIFSETNQGRS